MAHEFCPVARCRKPINIDLFVHKTTDSYLPCPYCDRDLVFKVKKGVFETCTPLWLQMIYLVLVLVAIGAVIAYALYLAQVPLPRFLSTQ